MLGGEKQEKTDDDSHHDEETGLGENVMQFRCHMEPCKCQTCQQFLLNTIQQEQLVKFV